MTVHELKIEPAYYWALYDGEKTFEVRFNDRDYHTGDILRFLQPGHEDICIQREVTYILPLAKVPNLINKVQIKADTSFITATELLDEWVVLSLKPLDKGEH